MKNKRFVPGDKFTWGPVVRIHEIGEFQIIEYHPQIFENNCGTGMYEKEKVSFHVHGESVSYEILDQAIVGAICRKYDGRNTRADYYIFNMINMHGLC